MKTASAIMLLAAALSLPAWAEVPHQPRKAGIESKGYVWNQPEKEKTIALSRKGDPAKGKESYRVCQGCHKENAAGKSDADFPQLAGQHITVLIKQMVDVRSGRRDNPKMHPFIASEVLAPEELADVAAYLNSLPIPMTNAKGDGKHLDRGKYLYDKDCALCHGDFGEGDAPKFYPLVASQHFDYLFYEAEQIRDGGRRNANPKMVKVIRKYSDSDLRDVSDYMSRLPPPPGKAALAPAK
ncbi:MAG: c-type cytochrome [Sulfuritalea sp.]|nr:c-type cytochrome [Sulfuritalea sp.]MDP1984455.1 c-type cytochrome [Sulfuritalea sp.]